MANTGQTLKQIDESLEKAQAAVSKLGASGITPRRDTRPGVGLMPAMPQ